MFEITSTIFFWTTAEHYLSLPDHIRTGYLDPEMYVASGSPRHVALQYGTVGS